MQMRRARLPQGSHGQRLATSGIAKALRRVLLSAFDAQNWRRIVIPSEARNLAIAVAITLTSLCEAARGARSFAPLRMTAKTPGGQNCPCRPSIAVLL